MTYDPRKDSTHPLGWSNDPAQQGRDERRTFGADRQSGQLPGESWDAYQKRLYG